MANQEFRIPMSLQVLTVLATLALVLVALSYGRSLLIPFVVAFVLVYLINALATSIHNLRFGRFQINLPLSYGGAGVVTALVIWFVSNLIANNVAGVAAVAGQYQLNFDARIASTAEFLGQDSVPTLRQITGDIDIAGVMTGVATSLAGIAGSLGIVLVYMVFLFLEQKTFSTKLSAITKNKKNEEEWRELFRRIDSSIRNYLAIKTLVSFMTATISYIILKTIGVDFAEFWALLIFILNYIPTFGSIIGTIFPVTLTLVQFDSWLPFIIVAPLLLTTQFLMGNIVEPRLMGKSLGISPLVILLSLALWGMLWGIVGMLLCVPITVILVIVLAHFPRTKRIAILLSASGEAET